MSAIHMMSSVVSGANATAEADIVHLNANGKLKQATMEGGSIESEDRSRVIDAEYQVEVKINAPI